ncbi:15918_t:CDS:1, partial [Acaulospora morrowiae]
NDIASEKYYSMTAREELLNKLLEKDIENTKGYYTEDMNKKKLTINIQEKGPTVYLSQVEENL